MKASIFHRPRYSTTTTDPVLLKQLPVDTARGVRLCRPPERTREIL